jgi:glycosyltransferase involved in cell wall biosynthesis
MAEKNIKPRILLVHQFFWAHFKAKIYSELQKIVDNNPGSAMLGLHVAANEKTRANLGTLDWSLHQYNVELLFNDFYENTNYFARIWAVLKRIHKFKPNVINLPGYYEPAMVTVMFYCLLRGIKVIIASDSNEIDNPNIAWKEAIKRFIVGRAHGFYCYGSLSAAYIKKLGGHNILMANNAVDNDYIRQTHTAALANRDNEKQKLRLKKYNFVFVGRFIPFKNLPAFTEAFCQIKTDDWGLIIVGDGEQKPDIQAVIAKHNAHDAVYFAGGQSWRQVPQYLALADVFVLPSYSEPWGLVANEAMACSMPVILAETCGSAIDLIQEGLNGFQCNPYSIDDMAAKMKYFVENPSKITEFGGKSYQIIQQFSPQNVAQQMYDGCVSVLNP